MDTFDISIEAIVEPVGDVVMRPGIRTSWRVTASRDGEIIAQAEGPTIESAGSNLESVLEAAVDG